MLSVSNKWIYMFDYKMVRTRALPLYRWRQFIKAKITTKKCRKKSNRKKVLRSLHINTLQINKQRQRISFNRPNKMKFRYSIINRRNIRLKIIGYNLIAFNKEKKWQTANNNASTTIHNRFDAPDIHINYDYWPFSWHRHSHKHTTLCFCNDIFLRLRSKVPILKLLWLLSLWILWIIESMRAKAEYFLFVFIKRNLKNCQNLKFIIWCLYILCNFMYKFCQIVVYEYFE